VSARAPEAVRARAGWPVPVTMLLLAGWLGAAMYFSAVVTRAAFAVLPSRTLAGALVGQTLPVLFDTGILVGACLVAVGLRRSSGAVRTTSIAGGSAIVALSGLARFVILARIARLRLTMPAAIDSLPATDPARRAFGQLHALSVGALGLAMLAGIVVAVVLAHSLSGTTHD
jgi:hypothetical protein